MKQNKDNVFNRAYFYEKSITLEGNSCIVDFEGTVLARLVKNIIPETLLNKLESTASKHREEVLKRPVEDSRGKRGAVVFGSYVERGGSGKIWTKKDHSSCPGFLEEIADVGKYMNQLFILMCPEIAMHVCRVPDEIKLWKAITLMFWNAESVSKSHVDSRDMNYVLVLPFGKFEKKKVDLLYLNTNIKQSEEIFIYCIKKKFFTM